MPRILHVKKQVPHTLITKEVDGPADHRRQLQTTADNATARASNTAWRFTKCCACHEFCLHGGSQSAAPATNSAQGGSQSAAPATNSAHGGSQSAAPATNSARQETSEYSNHKGGTDRRPPQTTCRQPPTTQQPEPLTEHGGSHSAAHATNSARQVQQVHTLITKEVQETG